MWGQTWLGPCPRTLILTCPHPKTSPYTYSHWALTLTRTKVGLSTKFHVVMWIHSRKTKVWKYLNKKKQDIGSLELFPQKITQWWVVCWRNVWLVGSLPYPTPSMLKPRVLVCQHFKHSSLSYTNLKGF